LTDASRCAPTAILDFLLILTDAFQEADGERIVGRFVEPLEVDQVAKRQAWPPPGRLQFRLVKETRDVAKADVGHGNDPFGDSQNLFQAVLVENTDPAKAQALGAGRQPQVLHGADGAVDIHLLDMRPPDHDGTGAVPVTGNADVDRGFENAFQFQVSIGLARLPLEHLDRLAVRRLEKPMDLLFGCLGADQNKVPGLHESHRRRVVGGHQNAAQNVFGDGVGGKLAAHVAPRKDCPVERVPLGIVETMAGRCLVGGNFHVVPFLENSPGHPETRLSSFTAHGGRVGQSAYRRGTRLPGLPGRRRGVMWELLPRRPTGTPPCHWPKNWTRFGRAARSVSRRNAAR